MEIGEALYHYRKKLGLTMEEMTVGIVTPSFYSKVEKVSTVFQLKIYLIFLIHMALISRSL